MPELLNMLSTPVDKDRRMLKAVGIECAAFIGTAAGKQVKYRMSPCFSQWLTNAGGYIGIQTRCGEAGGNNGRYPT